MLVHLSGLGEFGANLRKDWNFSVSFSSSLSLSPFLYLPPAPIISFLCWLYFVHVYYAKGHRILCK